MGAYDYDVFLSYRRAGYWPKFVDDHFFPKFEHWLYTTLGRAPSIFFDTRDIETGQSWPYRLAEGLARSKVMVCLWSKQYFSSQWCAAELSHMLARKQSLANDFGPLPLVLAVVIHDGQNIDPRLDGIQRFPLQSCCNPWIAEGSPTAELLSMKLQEFAEHVAHALDRVPEYDPLWTDLATTEFLTIFESKTIQDALPSLGPMTS